MRGADTHQARHPSRRATPPLILTKLPNKEDLRSLGARATYCIAC
jgi:hypothetical protein